MGRKILWEEGFRGRLCFSFCFHVLVMEVFNLLSRGDSPSKRTPNNSNHFQSGFISLIVIIVS